MLEFKDEPVEVYLIKKPTKSWVLKKLAEGKGFEPFPADLIKQGHFTNSNHQSPQQGPQKCFPKNLASE